MSEPPARGTRLAPAQLWGYVPTYDVAAAYASAEANRHRLSGLSVVRYHLDRDGAIVEYSDLSPLASWVREHGMRVVALIANHVDGRWSEEAVAGAIREPDRRKSHVKHVLERVEDYDGVEIDYEALSLALRERFSVFIEELAEALHRQGKQLAVALHAKTSEPGEGPGPEGQDWARIGQVVDRANVMTYDFDPSQPGPIASIGWTRDVLRLAVSLIPPSKTFQGIPLYGYHWSGDAPPGYVTYRETIDLAHRKGIEPRREGVDQHLVLEYAEGDVRHEVWLPDTETARTLAAIGREVGVAGYAVWRLGGEAPDALASLRTTR